MDRLRINTFGRMGPHDVAVQEGLYAAEQLEGSWQIVHSNADNIFWWAEDNGADFVIVMAAPSRPGQSFVVRPEITGYTDLRGKPLAVDAAESGYVTPLRVLLKQGGLAAEGQDFTLLEVGSTQHRIDAMRDGRAYGAMISAGQETQLVDQGFRVLDSIDRLYASYAGSAAVRRSWLEANQDTLLRYLRAHLRALRSSGREAPPFSWDGLTEMLETRQEVGLLRGAVDPHRFADDSYYRAAVTSL